MADQALDRAKEQEAAEKHLKILESGRNNLVNIAEIEHKEAEKRSEVELIEMSKYMLYNKGCVQKMAQIFLDSGDPEVAHRAFKALKEATDLRLQKRPDYMPTGSKADSILGTAGL